MAWLDYKKAYDMVPHSWIIESFKKGTGSGKYNNFLAKIRGKLEDKTCGESFDLVDIRRGIFKGDSLSPLIFAVCMIPLTITPQDAKAGYTLGDVKINNLFYMDDLKVY